MVIPISKFVAVNDLTSPATLAHLLKHDSILGNLKNDIVAGEDSITVDGKTFKVFAERDPAKLDWASTGAEIIVESTGHFTDATKAKAHLGHHRQEGHHLRPGHQRGHHPRARRERLEVRRLQAQRHLERQLHHQLPRARRQGAAIESVGIVSGIMTTIHSYTNDQVILDFPHKDLRRARAAAINMIPSSTGAAKALKLVIPETDGKLDGFSMRVPTPNVSIVDLTFISEKPTTVKEVNAALKAAAEGELKGILGYEDHELVSSDFKGNPLSSIVDAPLTKVIGNSVKVLSWYDNEWGYSNRVVDLIGFLVKKGL